MREAEERRSSNTLSTEFTFCALTICSSTLKMSSSHLSDELSDGIFFLSTSSDLELSVSAPLHSSTLPIGTASPA